VPRKMISNITVIVPHSKSRIESTSDEHGFIEIYAFNCIYLWEEIQDPEPACKIVFLSYKETG